MRGRRSRWSWPWWCSPAAAFAAGRQFRPEPEPGPPQGVGADDGAGSAAVVPAGLAGRQAARARADRPVRRGGRRRAPARAAGVDRGRPAQAVVRRAASFDEGVQRVAELARRPGRGRREGRRRARLRRRPAQPGRGERVPAHHRGRAAQGRPGQADPRRHDRPGARLHAGTAAAAAVGDDLCGPRPRRLPAARAAGGRPLPGQRRRRRARPEHLDPAGEDVCRLGRRRDHRAAAGLAGGEPGAVGRREVMLHARRALAHPGNYQGSPRVDGRRTAHVRRRAARRRRRGGERMDLAPALRGADPPPARPGPSLERAVAGAASSGGRTERCCSPTSPRAPSR